MRRPVPRISVRKRSIVIAGHKTSLSLENEFWTAFGEWANREKLSYSQLAGSIDDRRREKQNLSSAIRVAILDETRKRVRESELRAIKSEAEAELLTATVKSMVEARDRAAKTKSGLAPLSLAIAGRRADA